MSASKTELGRLRDEVTEARMQCICARLAVFGMSTEVTEQNAVCAVLDLVRDRLESVADGLNDAARKAGGP